MRDLPARNTRAAEAIAKVLPRLRQARDAGWLAPDRIDRQDARRRLDAQMTISSLPDGILPTDWDMRAFIYDVLAERKPVARGRGQHVPGEIKRRDVFIEGAIERVRQLGFDATRGSASRDKGHKHSACSLVTEALNRLGIPIGEDAVMKIWNNRRFRERD